MKPWLWGMRETGTLCRNCIWWLSHCIRCRPVTSLVSGVVLVCAGYVVLHSEANKASGFSLGSDTSEGGLITCNKSRCYCAVNTTWSYMGQTSLWKWWYRWFDFPSTWQLTLFFLNKLFGTNKHINTNIRSYCLCSSFRTNPEETARWRTLKQHIMQPLTVSILCSAAL